jgi:hypothetical protein
LHLRGGPVLRVIVAVGGLVVDRVNHIQDALVEPSPSFLVRAGGIINFIIFQYVIGVVHMP